MWGSRSPVGVYGVVSETGSVLRSFHPSVQGSGGQGVVGGSTRVTDVYGTTRPESSVGFKDGPDVWCRVPCFDGVNLLVSPGPDVVEALRLDRGAGAVRSLTAKIRFARVDFYRGKTHKTEVRVLVLTQRHLSSSALGFCRTSLNLRKEGPVREDHIVLPKEDLDFVAKPVLESSHKPEGLVFLVSDVRQQRSYKVSYCKCGSERHSVRPFALPGFSKIRRTV